MILSVNVGDFEMTGPVDSTKQAWSLIRDIIAMGAPTNLGEYLGRGHEKPNLVSHEVVKASMGHRPLLSWQSRTTNGSAGEDSQRQFVQNVAPSPYSEGPANPGGDSRIPIRNKWSHGAVRRKASRVGQQTEREA